MEYHLQDRQQNLKKIIFNVNLLKMSYLIEDILTDHNETVLKIAEIKDALLSISNERDITIIYASIVGSRAKELHNKKSDYDIRFIYKYNKNNNICNTSFGRELLGKKFPDSFTGKNIPFCEYTGFCIDKSIILAKSQNQTILEIFISKYVIIPNETFKNMFLAVYKNSNKSLFYSYRGEAKSSILSTKVKTVKTISHVIVALLASNYMKYSFHGDEFLQVFNINKLLQTVTEKDIKEEIIKLFDAKRNEKHINNLEVLVEWAKKQLNIEPPLFSNVAIDTQLLVDIFNKYSV